MNEGNTAVDAICVQLVSSIGSVLRDVDVLLVAVDGTAGKRMQYYSHHECFM